MSAASPAPVPLATRCSLCGAGRDRTGDLYRLNPATGKAMPPELALCAPCYEDACRKAASGEALTLLRRAFCQPVPLIGAPPPRNKPARRSARRTNLEKVFDALAPRV